MKDRQDQVKGTNKKKNILVFSNGSFGDGSITETVIKELRTFNEFNDKDKYKVVYITNKASIIPGGVKASHVYETPKSIFKDPMVSPADSSRSIGSYLFTNMFTIKSLLEWASSTKQLIKEMYSLYSPDRVIIHFSMVPLVLRIAYEDPEFLQVNKIPIFVFYYVPGFFNKTAPWIFDGRLRDRSFCLYAKDKTCKEIIQDSWDRTLDRFTVSTLSFFDTERRKRFSLALLKKMHHLIMWPRSLIPEIKSAIPNMKVTNVGLNMSSQTGKNNTRLPSEIREFLKLSIDAKKPVTFVSFGSFAKFLHLRALIPYIVDQITVTHSIIIHKTWKDDVDDKICPIELSEVKKDRNRCLVFEGFVSYDLISPKVSLIIGSGSLGLQSFSIKHETPMIMVPILTEQYYWSKNYEHFTGIPYIDIAEVHSYPIDIQVKKALNKVYEVGEGKKDNFVYRKKVATFLRKVSQEMEARDNLLLAKTVMKEE